MIKKTVGFVSVLCIILAICSCAPVTIDSTPSGAAVYDAAGQKQLGSTPFNTSVFVSEKNFTVRKERYFDEPVKLNYDSERNVGTQLRPMPVLVYSNPDADIYAVGADKPVARTPSKIKIGEKAAAYTLKAADYYDQEISVGLDSPDPLVVKLVRRPIVTLSAEPAGVEVYENNKLVGTTPLRVEILTSRTFELRKTGFFTQAGTLTGAPPYEVSVKLRPFPMITVTATPADAQIYRAGALLGKTTATLAVGEPVALEVRADRFYAQNVTLTPDSSAQVNVALKAMPYVTIKSEPSGADVLINGKSVGATPVEQLIEKETVIELRKAGFVTKTATLTGADKQVSVTLEAVPAPVEQPQPAVQTAPAKPESAVAAPVAAQKAAPEKKSGSNLPLIAGIAAVVVAGLVFFLIKRKKQE
ncbi:MAG: PEGA domain-containing protein [Kiritimatiellaceae bacterium]|nr:PEGA domain-containing protein [Kiritimatiellaceae bacterium]